MELNKNNKEFDKKWGIFKIYNYDRKIMIK